MDSSEDTFRALIKACREAAPDWEWLHHEGQIICRQALFAPTGDAVAKRGVILRMEDSTARLRLGRPTLLVEIAIEITKRARVVAEGEYYPILEVLFSLSPSSEGIGGFVLQEVPRWSDE